MSKFPQKGVSLYITVIILAIILAIVLGLSTILVREIIMIRRIGYSVVALYAADTGIERVLKEVYHNYSDLRHEYPGSVGQASYNVKVFCCNPSANPEDCYYDGSPGKECPSPLIPDPTNNCPATLFCIRSVGTFEETKRAIEVKL